MMTKKDKIWIKSMHFFYKYWGCHQMPERSFFIASYQMPVCARCLGIIIGEFLALIVPIKFKRWHLLMCLPMILDGGIQFFTKYESKNAKRLVSGLLFGFVFVKSIFYTIKKVLKKV